MAEEVINYLTAVEIPMYILRYIDGEIDLEIEETVRSRDVFVLQLTKVDGTTGLWVLWNVAVT